MTHSSQFLATLRRRWLPLLLLLAAATATWVVIGQTVTTKPIILSSDPLFAAAGGDKPTMALALSVEFPTVGAQYVATPGANTDNTYSNLNEYLGYYDAESCYTYNNAPTETPATGLTTADYKRFDRAGAATSRMCGSITNSFSGNFLNWASSSAIDMLRLALAGGDRYIDTPTLTILQRAVIPNGDPICMWNSGNFPAKRLTRAGGGTGAFWGAVPASMITAAGTNDIWIANTLNQMFFGTSNTGGCGNTGGYTLGGASSARQVGPVTNPYRTRLTALTLPLLGGFGGTQCATEGGDCAFTGVKEVLYGAVGTNSSNGGFITYPAFNGAACTNDVTGSFVDPAPGTGKTCYIRDYGGSWTPANQGTLNSDGFFYSRVQVCNVSGTTLQDTRDYDFCKVYPNGNYKPTGSIQKYSDQLRLAAFGYVMEQTASYNNGRYGGVLRAPMKFVGAKTFDTSGQDNTPTTGNPNAEWDASTGVFASNPDGDTSQTVRISGVINYLNKFGRTGPVAGRYKQYDPVGELHYETLRYLQGLQPSTAAVSGLTDPKSAFYDGFPITTTWTDPYAGRSNTADYSCLKSNIVVIGDVNTHDGNRLPTTNIANNIPDINGWRTIVQNFERNSVSTYRDGQGTNQTTGNPNTANGNPPSGTQTSQILGSAYWSHTHDIRGTDWTSNVAAQRPGLRAKSFFFDVNENGSANNTGYRQFNDQFFTASKYGGFETDASNAGGRPYNTYGNPFKRQDGTNDNNVWQDPANPGEAGTYYLQSNARGVLSAFDSIFSRASTSARSIAGSAVASKSLTAAGTLIYQSSFDTSDWSGDVLAFPVNVNGTGSTASIAIGATTAWTAATRLNALTAPATSRNITVGSVGANATPVAKDFTWATIDQGLKDNLGKPTLLTVTPDSQGQARLNYLRGTRTGEGTTFRARSKLLGDVVNSGVVYSGAPKSSISTDTTFAGFVTSNASRTPAVFVGANDGMMHSFNALTGDELFAYIPSWMGNKLAALTALNYNNNHQAYVDASPVVTEAKIGTAGTSADWKTVLVSGTGAGGSGVFALDVTSPSTFTAANAMWEFTRANDPDIGFVVGRPQIVKMRTSLLSATVPTYRWFAAVASGVNNYVVDTATGGTTVSLTGQPALFLLALDKPAGTAWTATGSAPNYYKISLPVDATLAPLNPTGLLNFRTTLGPAGEVQKVYMGDLHGKVWKLDFAPRGAAEWTMANLSAYNNGATTPVPLPLFIAKTSTGALQSITMAPLLAAGPVVNGQNTSIVAFGTGKYLETTDKTSTTQNSFYALFDDGTATADLPTPAGAAVIRDRLRLQAGTPGTAAVVVPAFKWGRATSNTDTTQRSGWYFDFTTSGERMVSSGAIDGNDFVVGSLIPASSGAVGSCTAAGGSGNAYELNIDSGNGSFAVSTVGLLGETLLADLSVAARYDNSTSTGRRIKTIVTQKFSTGSTAIAPTGTRTQQIVTGRLSWRQINNYLDLKNATP